MHSISNLIVQTYLTQSSRRLEVFFQTLEGDVVMLEQRTVISAAAAAQIRGRAGIRWNAGERVPVRASGM